MRRWCDELAGKIAWWVKEGKKYVKSDDKIG